MQGRPDQSRKSREDWEKDRERLTEARLAAVKITNQHRAIPPRPAGISRLEAPPNTPRVPRPSHQKVAPRKARRRLLILGSIFAVAAIIASVIGVLLASGILQSNGPASVTADFLNALNTKNYEQAYQDLGPAITIRINQQDFTRQAQDMDNLYGNVESYNEVADSATNKDNVQSYTYEIKRSKLKKTYKMHITLQQDPQDPNSGWKIIDYGTSLGPGQ